MAIRVLHVVDSLGNGGLENGLVNLIDRLDTRRFEHVVCAVRALGVNANRLDPSKARVLFLGDRTHWLSTFHIPALAKVIRETGPNIVHSRNWGAIESVIAARIAGSCAIVHSEHGYDVATMTDEPLRRRCLRRVAYELTNRVVSVSNQLREVYAARTGFPASRISVIHNGVDTVRFHPDPSLRIQIRRELGLSPDELCIGCVANFYPIKDHLTLLRAVEMFNGQMSDWRLLLIGSGPELASIQSYIDSHLPPGKVSILGSSNRVAELLNAMDVYVQPSIIEGVSNSLLEAMATGLTVVATNTGGTPEIVTDGESGLLFPVGDHQTLARHLQALHKGAALRADLGRTAQLAAQQAFSLERMVKEYDQMYSGLQQNESPADGRKFEGDSGRART